MPPCVRTYVGVTYSPGARKDTIGLAPSGRLLIAPGCCRALGFNMVLHLRCCARRGHRCHPAATGSVHGPAQASHRCQYWFSADLWPLAPPAIGAGTYGGVCATAPARCGVKPFTLAGWPG